MKVYIYGLGKGKQTLDRCLIRDDIEIIAYIDRYKAKKAELHEGIPVIDMKEISDGYDKIIITLMQYEDVKADLCAMEIYRFTQMEERTFMEELYGSYYAVCRELSI